MKTNAQKILNWTKNLHVHLVGGGGLKSMDWLTITSFATAEALATQVSQENYDKGLIYPPFSNIRKISAHIAANVAAKAYELGEFHELRLVQTTLVYFLSSFQP